MAEEMFGDSDPGLDAAAMKIMALGPEVMGLTPAKEPVRENREQRDPIEAARDGDLDEPGQEPQKAATEDGKDDPKDDKTGDGDSAVEDYIELTGAEGEEAEKVPLTEAIEAIKQVRELQGNIAAAVVKAESEFYEKSDGILAEIVKIHETVRAQAVASLQTFPRPTEPSREYLNPNSQHYNPETYHTLRLQFEDQAAAYNAAIAAYKEADENVKQVRTAESAERDRREHERLVRHWKDWADDGKRQAMQADLVKGLEKHYGMSQADFARLNDQITDHRLLLIVKEALDAKEAKATAKTKAPEVKAQVKERVAKVVRGNSSQARDANGTGRFVSQARDELAKTGSEAAMAAYVLRSGLAR